MEKTILLENSREVKKLEQGKIRGKGRMLLVLLDLSTLKSCAACNVVNH